MCSRPRISFWSTSIQRARSASFFGSTDTTDIAVSDIAITDGNWHYIGISYEQSSDGQNHGILEIYIDGFQTAALDVRSTCTTTADDCSIGVNATALDFVSWTIWSTAVTSDVMDVPEWGDPAVGTEAANDLVAAWDFANGPALDQGPNGLHVTVSQQNWHGPALTANVSSFTPNSADGINPSGEGAFSILAWVFLNTTSQNAACNVLSNNGGSAANLSVSLQQEWESGHYSPTLVFT